MEVIAKELRRSHSVAVKSNWIRHIKLITQTKISIYAMDINHDRGDILVSHGEGFLFISGAFRICLLPAFSSVWTCTQNLRSE